MIRRKDDDLQVPTALTDVVGMLQSPAHPTELRGFELHARELPRPAARHLGWRTVTLSALTASSLLFSGAVTAAAYTANLPEPVQRAAHRVLGPLGVPKPHTRPPTRVAPAHPAPDATSSPAAILHTPAAEKKVATGKAHATHRHPRTIPRPTPRPSVSPTPWPSGAATPGPLPTPSKLPPH